jgi:ESCRT-I complex subunit TSG101
MMIKPLHKHVDSKGTCYLPYLSEWNPQFTLLALALELIKIFTQDPPVRAKPKEQPQLLVHPKPNPVRHHQSASEPSLARHAVPPPASSAQYMVRSHVSEPPRPHSTGHVTPMNNMQHMPSHMPGVEEKALREALLRKVNTRLQVERSLNEKTQLDSQLEEMTNKMNEIDKWFQEHGNASNNSNELDKITEPADPFYQRLLRLIAKDHALEDSIYFLDKAVTAGQINSDTYTKTVRNLARRQFLCRAKIKKFENMRQQPQQQAPPPRRG